MSKVAAMAIGMGSIILRGKEKELVFIAVSLRNWKRFVNGFFKIS
jgi:hypothetical protein